MWYMVFNSAGCEDGSGKERDWNKNLMCLFSSLLINFLNYLNKKSYSLCNFSNFCSNLNMKKV